ncbi:conserved hypothetical protein, membrane [Candidatus Magnetobacterium bavaricum]|uniref:Uncharacterized protein n=1 Tax=Candidatus Magnetobacterium bavaricum TaxID=29290 RepID=A0A0F3GLL4_9BACT|nr:conserved hypothetical protein, membrane [Candidatus Magnetobacterium bavaricum]
MQPDHTEIGHQQGHKYLLIMNKAISQVLIIAMAGFLAYSNSFSVPFFFDDIQVIPTASSEYKFDYGILFAPRYVANLTFAINYKIHGENVMGYHLTNVVIHIANAMLVYLLVVCLRRAQHLLRRNTTDTSSPNQGFIKHEAAFFTALLFVSHPLQQQAVTLVIQRYTSLATLFYVLTILLYMKWRFMAYDEVSSKNQSLNGSKLASFVKLKAVSFYLTALVTALLASMTKQIVITLPVVITMIEFMFFSGRPLRRLLWCLPFYLMIPYIISLNLGYDIPIISAEMGNLSYTRHALTRQQYLFTEFRVITTYIRMLLFPTNLTLVYDYPIYSSFWQPGVYISFTVLVSIVVFGIYMLYRANRANNITSNGMALISFGILWFFIAISPQSSIVPIMDWVILEYRVYLASVGFFVVVVAGVFVIVDAVGEKKLRLIATISLLIISAMLIVGTYGRNAICQSDITAYEDNVMKSPHTFVRISLAAAYARKGVYDKSAEELSYILTYEPNNAEVYARLGFVYARQGRPDDAIAQYKAAIAIKADYSAAYNNLGALYMEQGRFNEAVEAFRFAVKFKQNIMGYVNLGDAYLRQGQPEEAMRQYIKASEIGENNVNIHTAHYRLGMLFESQGNLEKAADQYATAIKLNPNYAEAYNNLGVVFGKQGRIDDAFGAIKKAIDLRPDYADAHNNLGICLKLQGNIEQARQHFSIALKLDPSHANARENIKAMQ